MHSIDKRLICKNLYNTQLFSLRKIASIIGVSHMSIKRWIQQSHEELLTSKYHQIRRKTIKSGTPVVEAIKTMLKLNPILLIEDIQNKIYELFHFRISKSFLSSILRYKCSLTRKKVKFYGKTKQNDEIVNDFLQKRSKFLSEKKNFLSLDETSFSRKGKDVYGFSTKGKKIKIQKPWKRFTSKSCLACLDQFGKLQYHIIDGSYNKEKFIDGLEKFSFEENSVILMDNLKIHRSKEVLETFRRKGVDVLFVPPYSPWFNPIENAFSLIKMEFYKNGLIQDSINKTINKKNTLEKMFLSVLERKGM